MNLDDVERFRELDPSAMLNKIDTLPDQLEAAWKMGHELPLVPVVRLRHIVIAGMGGSAIGGDLLTYCLTMEELGRADSAARGIVSVSNGLVGRPDENLRAILPLVDDG